MDRSLLSAATAEKRQATPRSGAASQTEAVRRASFKHHGGPAGEAAP
ncbi:DUF6380 family protein [Streptomyces nodosus]|nr:hypothetical protein [Streptomyces nodosus]